MKKTLMKLHLSIGTVFLNTTLNILYLKSITVFLKPFDLKLFKDGIVLTLQEKNLISNAGIQEIEKRFNLWEKTGQNIFDNLEGHLLYSGSDDSLKKFCEDIVAEFDEDCLEFPRQLRQELKQRLNIQ